MTRDAALPAVLSLAWLAASCVNPLPPPDAGSLTVPPPAVVDTAQVDSTDAGPREYMTGSLGNFAVQDADADCQPVIIIHGGYVRSYFDCTASDTKGGLLMVVSFYNFDIRTLVAGEVLESTLAKQKQPDPVHGTFLHSIMCGNDVFPPKVPGYWDTCVEAERISVSVEAEDEEFLTLRYHGSHLELGAIEGVVAIPKER